MANGKTWKKVELHSFKNMGKFLRSLNLNISKFQNSESHTYKSGLKFKKGRNWHFRSYKPAEFKFSISKVKNLNI